MASFVQWLRRKTPFKSDPWPLKEGYLRYRENPKYKLPDAARLPQHDDFPLSIEIPDTSVIAGYKQASLLGCPAEVRNIIYSYIFEPRERVTRDFLRKLQDDAIMNVGYDLLLVCRQIYHECEPFIHKTVLITPQYQSPTSYYTIPLHNTRLTYIPSPTLQRMKIQDLVIRDYWHSLQVYHLHKTDFAAQLQPKHEHLSCLAVDTVWLQVCICQESSMNFHGGRAQTNTLCAVIRLVVHTFSSVRRVVVYFCGLSGPPPDGFRGSGVASARLGMKNALEHVSMDDGSPWWAVRKEPKEGDREKEGYKGGVWKYDLTLEEEPGVIEEKTVEVEFFDSTNTTRKKCVLA